MPSLGLDTSTRTQSVALASGGSLIAQVSLYPTSTHSETLIRNIDRVLTSAGLRMRDLSAIAVVSGPGSFTGLRIGMATAKGLAMASGAPLAGFSTLSVLAEALAMSGPPGREFRVCALVDAGRGQVYRGLYRAEARTDGGACVTPIETETACLPEEALRGVESGSLVGGDGALHYRDRLGSLLRGAVLVEVTPPLAPRLALIADALQSRSRLGDHPLAPNYVRPPDALKRPAR